MAGPRYNPASCAVYQTYTDEELYFQYLNKRPLVPLEFTPIYNLCPTQNSPVLRLVQGERQFDEMRWQLVPNWEPALTTKLHDQVQNRDGVRYSAVRVAGISLVLRHSDNRRPMYVRHQEAAAS